MWNLSRGDGDVELVARISNKQLVFVTTLSLILFSILYCATCGHTFYFHSCHYIIFVLLRCYWFLDYWFFSSYKQEDNCAPQLLFIGIKRRSFRALNCESSFISCFELTIWIVCFILLHSALDQHYHLFTPSWWFSELVFFKTWRLHRNTIKFAWLDIWSIHAGLKKYNLKYPIVCHYRWNYKLLVFWL